MNLSDIDTPAPVIDLDRVEANIHKLQNYCDQHSFTLRPHIKTHKLPVLAYKQLEAGATGITCQKVSEAAVMVAAGIQDILITYNVIGKTKVAPLAQLASQCQLSIAIDNELALQTVAQAALQARREIKVLVEFESGNARVGVQSVSEALTLAKAISASEYLHFEGLMTYPCGPIVADFVRQAKQDFDKDGLEIRTVSVGGTPGMWTLHDVEGVTELRAGTYIYHDRNTIGSGAASLEDCAMHVHAMVISRPTDTRAVIDAGSKTLSSDLVKPDYGEGYGLLLDYPQAVIRKLNEEHGIIDLSACEAKPQLGEIVRIVPNHTCVVTNLHDEIIVHRQGVIEGIWPVWARGKTR